MEDKIELQAFEIITYAGSAKALFLEALDDALEFNFESANKKIKKGKKNLASTHKAHLELITKDANKNLNKIPLLLIHAEDQFMSAENALVLAEKVIKIMSKFENKLK